MRGRRKGAGAKTGAGGRQRVGVVLVGQVPPPVHGQAMVNVALSEGSYRRLDLTVVPMHFARDLADVGRPRPGKVLELVRVVARARRAAKGGRRDVLVYGVGLRGRGAALRDLAVLGALRGAFRATVLQVHTGDARAVIDALPAPLRALARRYYGNADLVIYPDPVLESGDRGLPRPRRVEHFVYGIDDPLRGLRRSPRPVSAPYTGQGEPREEQPHVLFMSNLYPSKGTEVLLDAFAEVVERRRASGRTVPRLTLAGAAPDAATVTALTDRAGRLGVAALLDVPGKVLGDAKAELFATADVFCFPTFYEAEALPLVLLEAMGHGLPLVTTAWRAIPRVVTDGLDGLVVPPRDAACLADALTTVLDDPGLAERLGAAARATFVARYTVDAFRARFEAAIVAVHTDRSRLASVAGRARPGLSPIAAAT